MIKKHLVLALVGAALVSWGGSSLSVRLGLTGWNQADVALFALGIIFVVQAPYVSLLARVRRLEAELNLPHSNSDVAAS